MRILMKLGEQ